MNEPNNVADLLQKIPASAGSVYLNRVHQRTFSLNVFLMNAVELMDAAQRVKDPDQGLALMMEKNREAGVQAHRELNRLVHNFLAGAATLVDHTRVFMNENYAGTTVLTAYKEQVTATFLASPVAQFVKGLRNYMLHKGLPNSSMFFTFESDPDGPGGTGTMKTGVHYDTESLQDWDKWPSAARTYLSQAGAHLEIHEFAQEYVTLVNHFQSWLDSTLANHHESDLQDLGRLQARLEAVRAPRDLNALSAPTVQAIEDAPLSFGPAHASELDRIASEINSNVRELHFRQHAPGFTTDRPSVAIKNDELVGPITYWGPAEPDGKQALAFILHEGKTYGLAEDSYPSLEGLIDAILRASWARSSLSRKFIRDAFLDWARQRFTLDEQPFTEHLIKSARACVATMKVWAPIANMEVERGFDFGTVRIEPITAEILESFRNWVPARPEQEPQVAQLFDRLKNEIQGFAAVVLSIESEPGFAQERALPIAQDAVDLLRFFSPSAAMSSLFSPVALAGAEYVPRTKLIALREGGFSLTEGSLAKQISGWRLSSHQITQLNQALVDAAASLLMPEGQSEFALSVRASILTFSRGATSVATLDRLRTALSALEGVLLKHEMEPRSHSVANRMSFILGQCAADPNEVREVVRQVYWLQNQPRLSIPEIREQHLVSVFTSYAYSVLCIALSNIKAVASKAHFVTEIDRAGLSRQ